MMKKVLGMALLAGLMVVGSAGKSEAAFIAYVCDSANCSGAQGNTANPSLTPGANWYALADGAAVGSITGDGSANGVIVLNINIGGLTFLLNASQSKPSIGSASNPTMDLAFAATGTGTVWFYASDTDFTGNKPVTGVLSANWAGTGSINACISGLVDNSQLSLASQTCTGVQSVSPVTAFVNHVGSTTGANPWSMTLGLVMSRSTAGTMTGDYLVTSVPEPGSMVLLGTGLLGLAGLARRRFAKK